MVLAILSCTSAKSVEKTIIAHRTRFEIISGENARAGLVVFAIRPAIKFARVTPIIKTNDAANRFGTYAATWLISSDI